MTERGVTKGIVPVRISEESSYFCFCEIRINEMQQIDKTDVRFKHIF